jgi:hypothetical protein
MQTWGVAGPMVISFRIGPSGLEPSVDPTTEMERTGTKRKDTRGMPGAYQKSTVGSHPASVHFPYPVHRLSLQEHCKGPALPRPLFI